MNQKKNTGLSAQQLEAFFSSPENPILSEDASALLWRQTLAKFLFSTPVGVSAHRVPSSAYRWIGAFLGLGVGFALVFAVFITKTHQNSSAESLDAVSFALEDL